MEESAELLTCEDTKLVVKVPENATSGALTIEANKMKIVTSDQLFTVIPDPEMTEISPARVVGNAEVTITGENFGTVIEDVQLYCTIDGEEVSFHVTSCTDEEIKATAPETTVFGEFDLKLRIQGKAAKNTLKITLLEKPTITSVKSDNVLNESFAFAGDKVTISGTGFGTESNAVTVKFAGIDAAASIESCVNDKIVAIVRMVLPVVRLP
ncbi:MAG: IPT/TIG domain-containing protein [Bacteroides ovatus]